MANEGEREKERVDGILTLDAKMKGLASRFVQIVRCCADVLPGAAPRHALKDQALIRPDYSSRRVVRQYLVLKANIFVLSRGWGEGGGESGGLDERLNLP